MNTGLPDAICKQVPQLAGYGFYRRLNSGKFELMPYCSPLSKNWVGFNTRDLETMMNATIQKD